MKRTFLIIYLLCNSIIICAQSAYSEKYMQDANKVALRWLSNINHHNYEPAYKLLTEEIKERYDKESWTKLITELMQEFGDLKTRTIKDISFQSEVEGLEDGFYVFIEYDANYTKTKNHFEFLMLKQNYKAEWEISDYWYDFMSTDAQPEK
tara:strand:- start:3563 stop:4015 length:453 start_codon:yes stop_codon:yes gene_type:complete